MIHWCSCLSLGPCFHHYNTLTTSPSTSCSGLLQRPPNWSPCFCSCCIHPCQVCSTHRNQDSLLKTKSDHAMSLFKSSVSCATQGINKNGHLYHSFPPTRDISLHNPETVRCIAYVAECGGPIPFKTSSPPTLPLLTLLQLQRPLCSFSSILSMLLRENFCTCSSFCTECSCSRFLLPNLLSFLLKCSLSLRSFLITFLLLQYLLYSFSLLYFLCNLGHTIICLLCISLH